MPSFEKPRSDKMHIVPGVSKLKMRDEILPLHPLTQNHPLLKLILLLDLSVRELIQELNPSDLTRKAEEKKRKRRLEKCPFRRLARPTMRRSRRRSAPVLKMSPIATQKSLLLPMILIW